jgi:hypothetical protein
MQAIIIFVFGIPEAVFYLFIQGNLVKRLRSNHDNPIRTISSSPVDPGFVTGGDDCRARYWNIHL